VHTRKRKEQRRDMAIINALHKSDILVPIGTIISHKESQMKQRRTPYNLTMEGCLLISELDDPVLIKRSLTLRN
jgi:hypothetical protein